jgi:hypothetical protein
VGPAITDKMEQLQSHHDKVMVQANPTEMEKAIYECSLEGILDYIESNLDILEHKFLVFAINVNKSHWLSVVVVNPFVVFDAFVNDGADVSGEAKHDQDNSDCAFVIDGADLAGEAKHDQDNSDNDSDDPDDCSEICGWCVLNSNPRIDKRQKPDDSGFQGTVTSNLKASYGIHLFLNICASYMKCKRQNEVDGIQKKKFVYEEPYGATDLTIGTDTFARLDFTTPNIIYQQNTFDCGVATVANSMAFILHLKNARFTISNLETVSGTDDKKTGAVWKQIAEAVATGFSSQQVRRKSASIGGLKELRYEMNDEVYGLKPFWQKVFGDGKKRHSTLLHSKNLLMCMHQEFMEVVDSIASDSISNRTLFNEVQRRSPFDYRIGSAAAVAPQQELVQMMVSQEELWEDTTAASANTSTTKKSTSRKEKKQASKTKRNEREAAAAAAAAAAIASLRDDKPLPTNKNDSPPNGSDSLPDTSKVGDKPEESNEDDSSKEKDNPEEANDDVSEVDDKPEDDDDSSEDKDQLEETNEDEGFIVEDKPEEASKDDKGEEVTTPLKRIRWGLPSQRKRRKLTTIGTHAKGDQKKRQSGNDQVRKEPAGVNEEKKSRKVLDKVMPELHKDDSAMVMTDDETPSIDDSAPRCSAGDSCYYVNPSVVMGEDGCNGAECSKCQKTFHHVCLFVYDGASYCPNCYKEHVVSNCNTETLFVDVLGVDDLGKDRKPARRHTEANLCKFVDNYLRVHGYRMTYAEYLDWKKQGFQYIRSKPAHRKDWNKKEKTERAAKIDDFLRKNKRYKIMLKVAKEEWLQSMDGVVSGLRYKAKDKVFVARVEYMKSARVVKEEIMVTDDWVIDTYGKDLAKKLMHREENDDYVQPLTQDGLPATVMIDKRSIKGIKYFPEKYMHITDKEGNTTKTDTICVQAGWKAKLQDGTCIGVGEQFIEDQFGSRFVSECKALGNKKFVPIPVGSVRSSAMMIFPNLRCESVPKVKYMQGDIDRCVFSSLASAFFQTNISDLRHIASVLMGKSSGLSGGTDCLFAAKEVVEANARWLQPKRIPVTFNWENDINEYMFVVGVIEDSSGCCQHAVTIFRKWIYDGNEPFALPLSKKNLDICTWSIEDGEVKEASLFVRFTDGWIFQENETKKKKYLDTCA